MLSTTTEPAAPAENIIPRLVRRAGIALLAVALTGAGYLIWARGEAMVVDLSTLAGKVWCF